MDGAQFAALAPALSASWLAEAPDELHRRRTGSLVSADLSGFTAMSERLASLGKEGAERLTEIVNGCFDTLISIAGSEGGDVLKFGGDALLIWFEGDDGAERSARASVRMQAAIGKPRFAKLGLKMSVGAHHGDFDLFLVGEPEWRELVLLGAPVSRTVELESAAEAGQVLVSKELADLLPEHWRSKKTAGGVLLDQDAVPRQRRTGRELAPVPGEPGLVAPKLREEVSALASLGGEHRIASIVFLEVLGTDASLEQTGPEEFARGLDALVRSAQALRSGTSVQFLYTDVIADGVKLIATAGAPVSTTNDDESALRYAVDIVHGDPLRRLKGGVNSGRIFAGFLGSASRYTYTVMGDPVNLSARLMAHAEPGQVVVSTDVVQRSRARVSARELPPFLVKGKSKPVTAVVVDDVTETLQSPLAANDLPLVGREQELAELRSVVGQVADGRGCAVEILGEAGVGKSRLIAEIATDERLFQQVNVECQPYHSNTAYAAAKVVLRRLVGIPYSASAARAGELLARTVGRVRPTLLPMLPLLAAPLDAEVAPTPEADAIATDFVLARTHEAVVDLLTVMVGTPTLFLVEDAYYADPASAALFSALASRISGQPWLLIATNRPSSALLLTGVETVRRMNLEPLDEAAAVALAAAALHHDAGDEHRANALSAVADRAGGNPLFVLELMQAVRDGVATEDLPESVERIVAERLDRLGAVDRTLLRYAAVVGARFDTELLDLVLTSTGQRASDPHIWDGLGDLVERDGEHHVRFRHVLYRDVAYEGLPFGRRGRLHQRVGELIEASSQASDVALLAEHFFRAGDYERTWRYSVAAGDRAWEQLAVSEAAVAYERALKVRRWVRGLTPYVVARVSEARGDVMERSADYPEADVAYKAASRLVGDDPVRGARLLRKRGVLRERAGKYSAALRWYDRGRDLVAATDEPWLDAPLLVAAAGVMHRMGRTEDQADLARLGIEHAVRGGDKDAEAHASLVLQTALTHAGDVSDVSYGERALELFTETGNVLYQGTALNNLGVAQYFSGDWNAASEHYQDAADRYQRCGDRSLLAMARNNAGEILSDQGRTDEAVLLFEQAIETWSAAGYPLGCGLAEANLGRALVRDGQNAAGLAALQRALEKLTEIKSELFVVETRIRIVEGLLLGGHTELAAAALDEVAELVVAGGGFPGSDAFVARLRSWLARQTERDEDAVAHAREAITLAEKADVRFERTISLHGLAELTRDRALAKEADTELAALGVVRLPALPIPL
ncbi:hypothetical protein EFL95_00010 [Nocardioides marmorisolisilvae]|uniref:Guanylate cyclase domain-containing protein n=2 Tax=Nocardioides marmorisolisilvae TaxID=1542737 RepID=A0A3N0DZ26_9ACTN|nr:hypothetical protein EFL95_00010 [Nocardioides marmorisolisilvae]